MGLPRFACVAIAAFSLLPGFIMTGFAASPQDKSITLAEQGSFFVGGRIVQGKGVYDPAKDTGNTNEGNTFWTDQMYVQYQIPVNPRKYPLVLVHGGGHGNSHFMFSDLNNVGVADQMSLFLSAKGLDVR